MSTRIVNGKEVQFVLAASHGPMPVGTKFLGYFLGDEEEEEVVSESEVVNYERQSDGGSGFNDVYEIYSDGYNYLLIGTEFEVAQVVVA